MARELLGIATGAESEAVRLAAIKDALDRAGLVAPKTVDVAIAPKPWEQIFDDIVGGSRAESRRQRGMPDDQLDNWRAPAMEAASRAGEGSENDIVDAEVVEPEPDRNELPSSNAGQGDGVGRRRIRSVTSTGHDRARNYVVMTADRWPGGESVVISDRDVDAALAGVVVGLITET